MGHYTVYLVYLKLTLFILREHYDTICELVWYVMYLANSSISMSSLGSYMSILLQFNDGTFYPLGYKNHQNLEYTYNRAEGVKNKKWKHHQLFPRRMINSYILIFYENNLNGELHHQMLVHSHLCHIHVCCTEGNVGCTMVLCVKELKKEAHWVLKSSIGITWKIKPNFQFQSCNLVVVSSICHWVYVSQVPVLISKVGTWDTWEIHEDIFGVWAHKIKTRKTQESILTVMI